MLRILRFLSKTMFYFQLLVKNCKNLTSIKTDKNSNYNLIFEFFFKDEICYQTLAIVTYQNVRICRANKTHTARCFEWVTY